jgi:hypothetical protein
MSPLGRFILERFDITSGLSGGDIIRIAAHLFPNERVNVRYMNVARYARQLGLEIHSSYY